MRLLLAARWSRSSVGVGVGLFGLCGNLQSARDRPKYPPPRIPFTNAGSATKKKLITPLWRWCTSCKNRKQGDYLTRSSSDFLLLNFAYKVRIGLWCLRLKTFMTYDVICFCSSWLLGHGSRHGIRVHKLESVMNIWFSVECPYLHLEAE